MKASTTRSPLHADYLEKPAHTRTRKDRFALGVSMRELCPREAQGEYTVDWKKRPDPVEILVKSSQGRIENLVPIRYGRMATSPFAFFRGAAILMASDLADTPETGYAVQSCGDSHLSNFGAFATPERNIIFDINDFDETFPAPWEWDLKRLAASIVIASRHNGHKAAEGAAAAGKMVESYRDKMTELAQMKTLAAWYDFLCFEDLIEQGSNRKYSKDRKKELKKAVARDSLAEFLKIGHLVDGTPTIKDKPPLIYHDEKYGTPEFQAAIKDALEKYRDSLPAERRVLFDRYHFVDTAVKVVGVGSVGTLCMIALFFAEDGDPLVLQIKQASHSVLESCHKFPAFQSHGERVVFGQRLMQSASDIFLGHFVGILEDKRHFYVRQLRDVKVKIAVEAFSPKEMQAYAQKCGWALARAHSRSGDAAVLAGYIGKNSAVPDAVTEFARNYAEQNERDYKRFLDAIDSGRIEAKSGL